MASQGLELIPRLSPNLPYGEGLETGSIHRASNCFSVLKRSKYAASKPLVNDSFRIFFCDEEIYPLSIDTLAGKSDISMRPGLWYHTTRSYKIHKMHFYLDGGGGVLGPRYSF